MTEGVILREVGPSGVLGWPPGVDFRIFGVGPAEVPAFCGNERSFNGVHPGIGQMDDLNPSYVSTIDRASV
jgi:hypothetical protein